ncbi:hypothetical protein P7K49_030080 [Saguinus oedipus]|uniref:Uncharacterized protein n=1 Tax=Saguinus oedipus TaxID=9490 RepID=A0ABQ9U159_SAGOE|nr:hypothetical protein P7K49_030080 [Saguinus oedipus]
MGHGEKGILHLKEDLTENWEERRMTEIVKKHSQLISYPITLPMEKKRDKEVSNDEAAEKEEKEKEKDSDDKPETEDAGSEEEEDKKDADKEGSEGKYTDQELHKTKFVWTRNPDAMTHAAYGELCESFTNEHLAKEDKPETCLLHHSETEDQVVNSAFVECLQKRGFEVIYMIELLMSTMSSS